MNKDRKWQITLTEEQMCVMMGALEDWHRFISGQCSMDFATSYIDSPKAMHLAREILDKQVKPTMFPELSLNASYSWCGGQPNPHMSKVAAMSYMLYREMRHQLTLTDYPNTESVYKSKTLTCEEQGPMIDVRPIFQIGDKVELIKGVILDYAVFEKGDCGEVLDLELPNYVFVKMGTSNVNIAWRCPIENLKLKG